MEKKESNKNKEVMQNNELFNLKIPSFFNETNKKYKIQNYFCEGQNYSNLSEKNKGNFFEEDNCQLAKIFNNEPYNFQSNTLEETKKKEEENNQIILFDCEDSSSALINIKNNHFYCFKNNLKQKIPQQITGFEENSFNSYNDEYSLLKLKRYRDNESISSINENIIYKQYNDENLFLDLDIFNLEANNYRKNSNINTENNLIENNNNINYKNEKNELFSKNDNNLKNIINIEENLPQNINLYTFNYLYFKKNYYLKYQKFNIKGPAFIAIENIIDTYRENIKILWKSDILIFENENDLRNIEENSLIYKNLLNFLENKKQEANLNRKFMPDEMSNKIKTLLLEQIMDGFNSSEEIKNNNIKIKKIDANLINNQNKGDFNYIYLSQFLYSILSNESKYKSNNYEIIKGIIESYNKDKNHLSLIYYLCYTVQDCLDIIRYKKEDKTGKFSKKLIEFIIDESKKFQKVKFQGKQITDNEEIKRIKKDYIRSLLLLAFNLERFYYLRDSRGFRGEKAQYSKFLTEIRKFIYKKFFKNIKNKN